MFDDKSSESQHGPPSRGSSFLIENLLRCTRTPERNVSPADINGPQCHSCHLDDPRSLPSSDRDSPTLTEAVDDNEEPDGRVEGSLSDYKDDDAPSSCFAKDNTDTPEGKAARKKKTRTVFSRNQVFQLESTFDMKRYLSSSERAGLAASLHLSETQVKIWFQNRRNKWKRQISADIELNSFPHTAQKSVRVPILFHETAAPGALTANLPQVTPSLVCFNTNNFPVTHYAHPMSLIRSQMTGIV